MAMNDPRLEVLRAAFVRSSRFDVDLRPDHLRLERRRRVPGRGVLRLFVFPRVTTRIRVPHDSPISTTLPDGFAWLMSVVCSGGVAVEFLADRARYPRSYPPEFVFGMSAVFFTSLILEWFVTRRDVRRVLVGGP